MNKFKVGDKVVRVKPSSILEQGGIYTISYVKDGSCWVGVAEYKDKSYYESLDPFDEASFELYVDPEQQPDVSSAIVEWLDKLAYVIVTDTSVGSELDINLRGQSVLSTHHGDIIGNQNVVEFINNRYSQLTEQANKAKREQLLKDIVSAKEAYEAKVRELGLLEGK